MNEYKKTFATKKMLFNAIVRGESDSQVAARHRIDRATVRKLFDVGGRRLFDLISGKRPEQDGFITPTPAEYWSIFRWARYLRGFRGKDQAVFPYETREATERRQDYADALFENAHFYGFYLGQLRRDCELRDRIGERWGKVIDRRIAEIDAAEEEAYKVQQKTQRPYDVMKFWRKRHKVWDECGGKIREEAEVLPSFLRVAGGDFGFVDLTPEEDEATGFSRNR